MRIAIYGAMSQEIAMLSNNIQHSEEVFQTDPEKMVEKSLII